MDESKSTGERLLTGYYDRFTVEHLHRYALACLLAHDKDVLDIASGEGYGSSLLASVARTVVGVDIDPLVVTHSKAKYPKKNLSFMTGAAHAIPLESASVDLVVSFETLEHHNQHEEMYSEVKRVLRPFGVLVISTPNKLFFSDMTGHRNAYHVRELYFEQFLELNRRHFTHVLMYDQKAVLGSLIIPQHQEAKFCLHEGDHREVTERSSFKDPTYHLCLASNSNLESLGISLFDGGNLLDHMEKTIYAQSEKIGHLGMQLAAQSKVLSDIRESFSYRLGSALLRPLKFITKR